MLTHKEHTHVHRHLLSAVLHSLPVCGFLRPPGGHAGSHGQLQHHSQGAEAALQYAERRQRHLGKLVDT